MNAASSQDERRLYGDLAWVWETISSPDSYVGESEEFCKLIQRHSEIEAKTLLNLGCGGGGNDHTLKQHFRVTGVDVSEGMLAVARRRNPEVTYLAGDMRALRLTERFDCVAVFDSLNYMLTEEDLRATFATAFAHLKPGGVFVTYQEISPQNFRQNRVKHQAGAEGDLEVVFIENWYDPDPRDTTVEATFVYLIREGGRLRVETDRHLCGIFERGRWLTLLKETGFDVREVPASAAEEPTTFVCLKPL